MSEATPGLAGQPGHHRCAEADEFGRGFEDKRPLLGGEQRHARDKALPFAQADVLCPLAAASKTSKRTLRGARDRRDRHQLARRNREMPMNRESPPITLLVVSSKFSSGSFLAAFLKPARLRNGTAMRQSGSVRLPSVRLLATSHAKVIQKKCTRATPNWGNIPHSL
jgi:hypothetical protein